MNFNSSSVSSVRQWALTRLSRNMTTFPLLVYIGIGMAFASDSSESLRLSFSNLLRHLIELEELRMQTATNQMIIDQYLQQMAAHQSFEQQISSQQILAQRTALYQIPMAHALLSTRDRHIGNSSPDTPAVISAAERRQQTYQTVKNQNPNPMAAISLKAEEPKKSRKQKKHEYWQLHTERVKRKSRKSTVAENIYHNDTYFRGQQNQQIIN